MDYTKCMINNKTGKYKANHMNKKQRIINEIYETYRVRFLKDLTIKELNNLISAGFLK